MSIRKISVITLLLCFFNLQSFAEIKTEKKFKMWESQYMSKDGKKVCFAVSMPTNMSPKNLSRAESRIFVSFRPSESINNEISITGGYKYKKKSQVRVNVGNSNFKLEIKDNFAWLVSYDDEIRMIRAMKKSNKAKVIGISSRGNKTIDTYSLMGFTDAYNAARKNCRR